MGDHGMATPGKPKPLKGSIKMAKFKSTVKTGSKVKRPDTDAETASSTGRMYE